MTGRRIEARAGSAWSAILIYMVAVGLFALVGVVGHIAPAILAVLPLAVGTALWATRTAPFSAEITAEGIEVVAPPLSLPYREMQGLKHAGSLDATRFAMRVYHPGGRLVIPAGTDVPSRELFDFLAEQLPRESGLPLPAALEEYRLKHHADFGPERVQCFRTRQPMIPSSPWRRAAAVSLAVAVAGGIWLAAGIVLGSDGIVFVVVGILFAIFGLLFAYALQRGDIDQTPSASLPAGLVISPVGLALVQGTLRGVLRWDEIRKIQFPIRRNVPGLALVVEGATIVVADVFDRPLTVVHRLMLENWEG